MPSLWLSSRSGRKGFEPHLLQGIPPWVSGSAAHGFWQGVSIPSPQGFSTAQGPFCPGSQGPFLWDMPQAERAKARARMMVNKTRLFMIVSV